MLALILSHELLMLCLLFPLCALFRTVYVAVFKFTHLFFFKYLFWYQSLKRTVYEIVILFLEVQHALIVPSISLLIVFKFFSAFLNYEEHL